MGDLKDGYTRVEYDRIIVTKPLAWYVDFGDIQTWIPKSQAFVDERNKTIDIADWLYKEKGL